MIHLPDAKIELAASTDKDSRPQLNAVYFDAEAGELCTADGFIMAVHPVTSDGDKSGMISAEHITLERKAAKKNKGQAAVGIDGEHAFLTQADLIANTVEGTYPAYGEIMKDARAPSDVDTVTFAIDATRLYNLAQALMEGKKSLPLVITVAVDRVDGGMKTNGKPITARPLAGALKPGGPVGLIMPMHMRR